MGLLSEPGDLSTTPLAAILLEALNVRADGVLEIVNNGGTSRIWFREGRPAGAAVFLGFHPLGQMLLDAGLIDIDALSRSLAKMAETHRPQGEILVGMGACSKAAVDAMLETQQSTYFNTIASLEGGSFSFLQGAPIPEWTKSSRLYPLRTIVDALEKPHANGLVTSALELNSGSGIRLASGYYAVADGFRFNPVESVFVARLEKPRTRAEALLAPGLTKERACAILAGLLLLGLAVSTAEQPLATGQTEVGLGDVNLTPEEPSVSGRRSDPVEARARRQRLLLQAMRNMGVAPFTRPAQSAASKEDARPGTSGGPGTPFPGSAEGELRDALLKVAPRARSSDYFERLGLTPDAKKDDVKAAFLAIARQFHPDRFSAPALAGLADVVKDFFSAVNEAYDTLSDDVRRAEYERQHGGGRNSTTRAARGDFEKGEACARTKDWVKARAFYESAVRTDPKAEYLAALAQVLISDPAMKDRERAGALLDDAMRDPSSDRALFVAGLLARDENEFPRAEKMLRQALRANPKNAEAARELKAVEAKMRVIDSRRGRH